VYSVLQGLCGFAAALRKTLRFASAFFSLCTVEAVSCIALVTVLAFLAVDVRYGEGECLPWPRLRHVPLTPPCSTESSPNTYNERVCRHVCKQL